MRIRVGFHVRCKGSLQSGRRWFSFSGPVGDPTAMRRAFTFAVTLSLLACIPISRAWADEATCVVHVEGEPTGNIFDFHDAAGELLVGAEKGLFRYDGKHTVHVEGEPTG